MDTMGYLRKIGQFGKNPDGSYTRRIFSPEWERAADLVRSEMKALSMKTDRDAAGNEQGVLLGSVPGLPAIILGSHLDTVPSGVSMTAPWVSQRLLQRLAVLKKRA